MKKTKKNEAQWYVFFDGKNLKIMKSTEEVSALKGVILNISAHEAASMLSLILESKGDQT